MKKPFQGKTRNNSKQPENGDLFATVCYFFVLGRFRPSKTGFLQVKTGQNCPRFLACFETIANTFSTDYSKEFTRVEQIFFETV
jgi:hypothetical protein